ncbi:MAG: DUF4292 domain-containing protein [Candidatus Cardinium sp.]|nr:MAG: DUF4292 domain-containing protein [Candidatus Cardinium sp.]
MTTSLNRYKRLAFLQLCLTALYLFAGCGMQQAANQSFDVVDLLTVFPRCFSMQASLDFMGLHHAFRYRLVCCVTYNQQIDFIVKGPFGIALIAGVIDKKGVTVVAHRVVHQWDYKQIQEQYHFPCNYLLIQSLLLGRVYSPMEDHLSIPDGLWSGLAYTYDTLRRKVTAVQLINQDSSFKCLYRYKMAADTTCLSRMNIYFSLRDKQQLYQGRAVLHKLHFKKLKKPNIRLRIPKRKNYPLSRMDRPSQNKKTLPWKKVTIRKERHNQYKPTTHTMF